jgi:hypothetical protein
MLLIVAQRNDLAARSLADRWRPRCTAVLTARDLSVPGWKFDMPAQGPSRLIADGRAFSSNQIAGVLTRLSAVPEGELDHVAAEDRAYVSAEMTAFLLAWLSSLECPVLNRPTPSGLCGPGWRIEQWLHLAAGLGIPVRSVRRSTSRAGANRTEGGVSVTIVGRECLGTVDPALADYSRRLAAAADVDLLEVRYTSSAPGARLQSVSLWPDVSRPDVAAALLHLFDSRVPC